MDEELKQQTDNKPWLWKKGQSGNPKGRPPGRSIKDRAKAMLASMTDEEFQDFLHGLDKKTIWEMAEGKPDTKTELTGKDGTALVFSIAGAIADKNNLDAINPEAGGNS